MSDKQSGKRPQQLLNIPRDPPSFPPPSCPRCSSSKTKFCYYNNYSVSQPRYLCKDCRRYWTHGGAIRSFPNNGTNRKRGRVTSASSFSQSALLTTRSMGPRDVPVGPSTSQFLLSQHSGLMYPALAPKSWSTGSPNNLAGGGIGSSIGSGTFRLPINETNQFFTGDGFCNQTTFVFSPNVESGAINNAFGAVNACYVSRAPPQPVLPSPLLHYLSPVGASCELGIPFLQPPQHQLIPSPQPTTWTTQNMASSSASTNNLIPKAREMTTAENVVSINEWPEFDYMDIEGDPLQSYKSPSP